jgi:cell division protease FtsH
MLPPKDSNSNEQQRQTNGPQAPRWMPDGRIWLILLGALLLWNIFGIRPQEVTLNVPYSSFVQQVRDGKVKSVQITEQEIKGTYVTPQPVTSSESVTGGLPFSNPPEALSKFTSVQPSTGDDRLLALLEEKGVEVIVQVQQPSIFLTLMVTLLPTLLIVGLLVFMMRQQTRGQQGIFSFGRSRAKEHTLDRPTVKFTDVAGADEAKRELVEVVDFLKNPDRYKALGAKIPRGALLVGPPGTGKTLLARAVAGEAGVPFFSTSASEFVELFVGVGASRVRDLFDQARRNAPAIVFIDELDAIGRQRGAGMGGGNDEREQTLNQILVEMDGFEGGTDVIIIAATNRPDVLDPALLRPGRFDRQITVGLPDVRGREAVLNIHLRGKPTAPDINPSLLARQTPGFAGADLANLVNEAALHAARRGDKRITMRHFAEALDKIVLGTERPVLMTEHDRKVIAYHEAGHALVGTLLPESDPVTKVTIIPRGRALGVTQYAPEGDRYNYSRLRLLTKLATLLGGRAAEMVAIGEITTGAESDLQRATQLARSMVGRWGMSEEVGLLFADESSDNPFLGREMAGPRMHSEATAARLDNTVRNLLDERMELTLKTLNDNRDALDRIAQALLEHETIDQNGLMAAIRGDDVPPPSADWSSPSAPTQPTQPPAPPQPRPGLLPS